MASSTTTKEVVAINELKAEQGIPKFWQASSCHCGAVKFEVFWHESLYQIPGKTIHVHIMSCNCSICLKNGYLMIYPVRDEIKWHSGWDTMKTYRCGSRSKEHRFCGVCESSVCIDFLGSWSEEGDLVGVNARLIEDVDTENLKPRKKNQKTKQVNAEICSPLTTRVFALIKRIRGGISLTSVGSVRYTIAVAA